MLTPHCDLGLRSQWFTFGVEGDLQLGREWGEEEVPFAYSLQ